MRHRVPLAVAVVISFGLIAVPQQALARSHIEPNNSATLRPITQTLFSDPVNNPYAIRNGERQLVVAATLPGWVSLPGPAPHREIQASLYHLTDVGLAQRLVAAAAQGDPVHVLLDGSNKRLGCHGSPQCINPAFAILEQLNATPFGYSWLKTCNGLGPDNMTVPAGTGHGCIGRARDHNKFILFSDARMYDQYGQEALADDVVLQTSSNNTHASYTKAFNDALITANQPAIFDDYTAYFHRLAATYDATSAPSVARFSSQFGYRVDTTTQATHDMSTWSFPQPAGRDPIANALASVDDSNGCVNLTTGSPGPSHTAIAVAMSRIDGRTQVMQRLVQLQQAGCRVEIVYAQLGEPDREYLQAAHIGLHRLCLASPTAPQTPIEYVHSKYLLINGTVNGMGANARVVLTGSENLNNQALTHTDDRMERYTEPADNSPVFDVYAQNFWHLLIETSLGHQATSGCDHDD